MSRFWERVSVGQRAHESGLRRGPSLFGLFWSSSPCSSCGDDSISHAEPPTDGRWLSLRQVSVANGHRSARLQAQHQPTAGYQRHLCAAYCCLCLYDCLRRTDVEKLLRADNETNALIASGTAICGGTTIATLSPIIGARAEQTGAALCIVFLLNAIALLAFQPSDTG